MLALIAPAAINLSNPPMIQDAKYLRDYAETRGFNLGRPTHAQPTPDGKAVLFLRAQPRTPKLELYEFDVAAATTRRLLSPEELLQGAVEHLSPQEKALRERMRVSVGGFSNFQLTKDGHQILLSLSGKLYVFDRQSRSVEELKTGSGAPVDPKFSPDGTKVAYVLEHDVYVYDLKNNREQRLTHGGTEQVSHGLAEFVASEEMLRFSGFWWAPDSQSIAFEESDGREVEVWYGSDPAKPGEAPFPVLYPRPGKANVKVRVGIAQLEGGDPVWLQWDAARFPYLTTVVWEENGPLTLGIQTRDQKEVDLLSADEHSGVTRILLAEHDPAWVSVRQDVPRWLGGGRGFIWAHEQAGSAWQLEWRRPSGELKRVLVPGSFGFRQLEDVNSRTGEITFTARPDPTQWRLYRVSLEGGEFVELSPERGCHTGRFDKEHTLYVENATSLQSMSVVKVRRIDGSIIAELPSVAEEPPALPQVEIEHLGVGAGFYAALVRPHDFAPQKRYPVIVHVYGGPLPDWSSGMVVSSMASWLLPQWIADQGFIVVSLDGRGTPGRGHDWERAIALQFGSVPLVDQVSGLRALGAKFRELDLDRVGIYGWSFGGYMSALAVLKEPGMFKAAVAGAPPTDWYDYDTHYTERYLGVPPATATAYEESSLLHLAKDLSRPLLLVHGTGDDNVYFRHSLKLIDALFRAGKSCEVLPLSGLTHMVPDPVVNEQLYSRIVRHFKEHLGGPE